MDQVSKWLKGLLSDPIKLIVFLIVVLVIYCWCQKKNNKTKQKGGFMFGGDSSTSYNQLNEQISTTVNDTFIKQTQRCQAEAAAEQIMSAKCALTDASRAIIGADYQACLDAVKSSVATTTKLNSQTYNILLSDPNLTGDERIKMVREVQKMRETDGKTLTAQSKNMLETCERVKDADISCDVSNNTQEQMVKFQASCEFNDQDAQEFQQELGNELKKKSEQKGDALGEALTNLTGQGSGAFADASTEVDVQNIVTNDLTNIFTKETMEEMFAALTATQTMVFEGTGGSSFTGNRQVSMASMMMDYLSKNEDYRKVMSEIKNKTDDEIIKAGKGLTDIVDDVTDTIDNVVDTVGDVAETGIEEAGQTFQLMIIGGIVVVGLFVFMFFKSGVASQAVQAASDFSEQHGEQLIDKMG